MRGAIALPHPSSQGSIGITTLQPEVRRALEKGHKRSACRRATKSGRVSTVKDFHPLFFAAEQTMPNMTQKEPSAISVLMVKGLGDSSEDRVKHSLSYRTILRCNSSKLK